MTAAIMNRGQQTAYAALCIAPFVLSPGYGGHWRFGRRLFNATTVAWLIAAHMAIRTGNRVYRRAP